jgi:hypothetical protein
MPACHLRACTYMDTPTCTHIDQRTLLHAPAVALSPAASQSFLGKAPRPDSLTAGASSDISPGAGSQHDGGCSGGGGAAAPPSVHKERDAISARDRDARVFAPRGTAPCAQHTQMMQQLEQEVPCLAAGSSGGAAAAAAAAALQPPPRDVLWAELRNRWLGMRSRHTRVWGGWRLRTSICFWLSACLAQTLLLLLLGSLLLLLLLLGVLMLLAYPCYCVLSDHPVHVVCILGSPALTLCIATPLLLRPAAQLGPAPRCGGRCAAPALCCCGKVWRGSGHVHSAVLAAQADQAP